jgi:hypothetical protein
MFISLFMEPVLWVIVVDDDDLDELMEPELFNAVSIDAVVYVSRREGLRVTIKVAVVDPAETCAFWVHAIHHRHHIRDGCGRAPGHEMHWDRLASDCVGPVCGYKVHARVAAVCSALELAVSRWSFSKKQNMNNSERNSAPSSARQPKHGSPFPRAAEARRCRWTATPGSRPLGGVG